VELKILEHLPDLHWAMRSRENELDYLRLLGDILVERLVDGHRIGGQANDEELMSTANKSVRLWPSRSCPHFIRELVVSTVLLPVMDFTADPDTLNK
jgi:hypothetical protein